MHRGKRKRKEREEAKFSVDLNPLWTGKGSFCVCFYVLLRVCVSVLDITWCVCVCVCACVRTRGRRSVHQFCGPQLSWTTNKLYAKVHGWKERNLSWNISFEKKVKLVCPFPFSCLQLIELGISSPAENLSLYFEGARTVLWSFFVRSLSTISAIVKCTSQKRT